MRIREGYDNVTADYVGVLPALKGTFEPERAHPRCTNSRQDKGESLGNVYILGNLNPDTLDLRNRKTA